MNAHATAQDLSLLIDRQLAREREEWVEQHLQDCEVCREHYQSTRRLVEHLQGLERVAPPSTLGMVVQQHRTELGNSRLRRRLERNWKRWPDPMILVYLAVVLALGAMAVMVTRAVDSEDLRGTMIYTPGDTVTEASEPPAGVWIESGISEAEVIQAVDATPEQSRRVIERLGAGLPEGVRKVIARDGDQVLVVRLSQPTESSE